MAKHRRSSPVLDPNMLADDDSEIWPTRRRTVSAMQASSNKHTSPPGARYFDFCRVPRVPIVPFGSHMNGIVTKNSLTSLRKKSTWKRYRMQLQHNVLSVHALSGSKPHQEHERHTRKQQPNYTSSKPHGQLLITSSTVCGLGTWRDFRSLCEAHLPPSSTPHPPTPDAGREGSVFRFFVVSVVPDSEAMDWGHLPGGLSEDHKEKHQSPGSAAFKLAAQVAVASFRGMRQVFSSRSNPAQHAASALTDQEGCFVYRNNRHVHWHEFVDEVGLWEVAAETEQQRNEWVANIRQVAKLMRLLQSATICPLEHWRCPLMSLAVKLRAKDKEDAATGATGHYNPNCSRLPRGLKDPGVPVHHGELAKLNFDESGLAYQWKKRRFQLHMNLLSYSKTNSSDLDDVATASSCPTRTISLTGTVTPRHKRASTFRRGYRRCVEIHAAEGKLTVWCKDQKALDEWGFNIKRAHKWFQTSCNAVAQHYKLFKDQQQNTNAEAANMFRIAIWKRVRESWIHHLLHSEVLLVSLMKQEIPHTLRASLYWRFLSVDQWKRSQFDCLLTLQKLLGKKIESGVDNRIRRDLDRTYPRLPFLAHEPSHPLGNGQRKLHTILRAYAAIDPEVGYCQGLNWIAALLLLATQPPEALEGATYEDDVEDGDDVTEGGDDVTEGGDDVSEGGDDVSEGGDDVSEGGGDVSEGGDDVSEGGDSEAEGGGGGGSEHAETNSGDAEATSAHKDAAHVVSAAPNAIASSASPGDIATTAIATSNHTKTIADDAVTSHQEDADTERARALVDVITAELLPGDVGMREMTVVTAHPGGAGPDPTDSDASDLVDAVMTELLATSELADSEDLAPMTTRNDTTHLIASDDTTKVEGAKGSEVGSTGDGTGAEHEADGGDDHHSLDTEHTRTDSPSLPVAHTSSFTWAACIPALSSSSSDDDTSLLAERSSFDDSGDEVAHPPGDQDGVDGKASRPHSPGQDVTASLQVASTAFSKEKPPANDKLADASVATAHPGGAAVTTTHPEGARHVSVSTPSRAPSAWTTRRADVKTISGSKTPRSSELHDEYELGCRQCEGLSTLATRTSEEDAFWMLVTVMQQPQFDLRRLFVKTMPRLRSLLLHLQTLTAHCLPRLHRHFENGKQDAMLDESVITTRMYALDWLMTLFGRLHLPLGLRVMDAFLFFGWPIVLKVAIALLMEHEDELLSLDFCEALQYCRDRIPARLQSGRVRVDTLMASAHQLTLPKTTSSNGRASVKGGSPSADLGYMTKID